MKIRCIGTAVVDIAAMPVNCQTQWAEKQRISDIRIRIGGDAANQSVHLADLGADVCLTAAVGTDNNGALLEALLQSRGVNCNALVCRTDIATGTSLVLIGETGERHTFSVKGAHSTLCSADLCAPAAEDAEAISLASLFSMPELERDGLREYLFALKNVNHRKPLVFADLANDKLGLGLDGICKFLPLIDYFLPSEYDALAMTGADTPEKAAELYRSLGTKNVVIKCGARGAYYLNEEEHGWAESIPVEPVDTTGAGDCMCAFFIERILKGYPLGEACRMACRAGSVSTLYAGACEKKLTWEQVLQHRI